MMNEGLHPGFTDVLKEYLAALEQCLPTEEIRHIYALHFAELLYGASSTPPLPLLCAATLLAQVVKERHEEVGTHGL